MINCNEFNNLLDALVDAELDPADRAAAREHLGTCAACARLEYATLRVKEIVHEKADRPGLRNSSAGAALRSRLEERLRGEAGREPRSRSVATRPTRKIRYLSLSNLGVAAAILILATLAFFFLPGPTTPKLGHYVAAEGVSGPAYDPLPCVISVFVSTRSSTRSKASRPGPAARACLSG